MRRRSRAFALAGVFAALAAPATGVVPAADRIAGAIAEHNRESGRARRIGLDVALVGASGGVEATGQLWSDPRGFARLELLRPDGARERFLMRGGRFGASRDGERMPSPPALLPPLFLLQVDTESALRAALLALGGDPNQAVLGHTEREDCYVLGGRDIPDRASEPPRDRVAFWVDQETFEAVAIHLEDGVRFHLGPTEDHAGLRVPAWIDIDGPGRERLRLEIRAAEPVDAAPGAFDPSWLRSR
ncbi:MAG: hypothetical protein JSU66_01025 [Deltaproteobacteria bacterium]|nr:MAG: hypothetical protein JSU66_01025 [Deltaproteobacteria bacterium]